MTNADAIERIKSDLADNYKDDNDSVLMDIYGEVSSIASQISNRNISDENLFPYIKKAVKATYLARGGEGLQSLSQSGTSSTFDDIIERLRNDIIRNGLRRFK